MDLPRNGAPFNIPLVVEFKLKSISAAGEINDTAVVDIAQDIFTKPHTTNNTIWYVPVPKIRYTHNTLVIKIYKIFDKLNLIIT